MTVGSIDAWLFKHVDYCNGGGSPTHTRVLALGDQGRPARISTVQGVHFLGIIYLTERP